jgi:hypothetical protein
MRLTEEGARVGRALPLTADEDAAAVLDEG